MNDIKPCTVKGCTSTEQHHHERSSGALFQCPQGGGSRCSRPNGAPWVTPLVAPRLTRKALNARIAALEAENSDLIKRGWAGEKVICDLRAENADLFAEIADKKDRLARCEKFGTVVRVEPYPIEGAVSIHIDGNECAGLVFGHRDGTFHGCAASVGIDGYYLTQDEAVTAIVSAWRAAA